MLSPTRRVGPMRRPRRRARHGSTQLEFALVLPFFLLFIAFSLNVGILVMQHGAVQHATNAAARAGAQVGGASVNNASRNAFNQTIADMPSVFPRDVGRFRIISGSVCSTTGRNRDVVVEATYNAPLTVPGVNQLLEIAGGDSDGLGAGLRITSVSVARCEVVRR